MQVEYDDDVFKNLGLKHTACFTGSIFCDVDYEHVQLSGLAIAKTSAELHCIVCLSICCFFCLIKTLKCTKY